MSSQYFDASSVSNALSMGVIGGSIADFRMLKKSDTHFGQWKPRRCEVHGPLPGKVLEEKARRGLKLSKICETQSNRNFFDTTCRTTIRWSIDRPSRSLV
eukprot:Selendium_serpulae@DN4184_c0_g1_i1.p1